MEIMPPVILQERDKLEILQSLDRHRQWRSLDETRYCIVCGEIITGREIQVVRTRESDSLKAICPSQDCNSIPMDWVRPSDEVLAMQAELADEPPTPPDRVA
ncbi:MAG: hypothetical protein ABI925_10380 [Verrucomicrobiota bacterium]